MYNGQQNISMLRSRAIEQYKAGNLPDAQHKLETLVKETPEDWEAWNMLGALYGMQGNYLQCEHCCRQVIALMPTVHSTHNNLGNALKYQGKTGEARNAYASALQINPDYPEALNNLGNLERETGNHKTAIDLFERAIKINPGYSQAYNNLGNVYKDQGDLKRALQAYTTALNHNPDYPDALINTGMIYQLEDQLEEAERYYRKSLLLDPQNKEAIFNLGVILEIHGDLTKAEQCFRNVLKQDPDHVHANYFLASIRAENVPDKSPPEYVSGLFDTYAPNFDEHLVHHLSYHVPEQLFAFTLAHTSGLSDLSILDLGCGTGLCGVAFKSLASHMDGVDLSGNMVKKTTARGIYDSVYQEDVTTFLASRRNTYDLLVSADVFIYIGELEPLFDAASHALHSDGYFCFSVEHEDTDKYKLRTSGRYAHGTTYLHTLANTFDFSIIAIQDCIIRKERGSEIEGQLVLMQSNKVASQ